MLEEPSRLEKMLPAPCQGLQIFPHHLFEGGTAPSLHPTGSAALGARQPRPVAQQNHPPLYAGTPECPEKGGVLDPSQHCPGAGC